jgi:hypothetical protein
MNKLYAVVAFALVLSGCGGGSTGSGTPNHPVPQPTPNVNIIGTWTGTLTDSFDNNGQTLTLIVKTEQGTTSADIEGSMTIGGFCDSNLLQTTVTGGLTPAGQPSGTLKLQNYGTTLQPPPEIFLTGTLTDNNSITGTWQTFYANCVGGTAGKFSLTK